MGKTVVSENGNFEWDKDKSLQNRKKHGFSFDEILEVFDDPAFLEGYDWEHSEKEDRYYGIGCLNNILYITVFYTYRNKNKSNGWGDGFSVKEAEPSYIHDRRRIFSARRSDSEEQENYNEYFKKIKP